MDVLVQKLFGASGRFSTDEQSFLKTQTGDVQKAFALRSAQELVTSGLFESAGAALFASLDAQGMSAAEKADRAQNQNAYLRAFVESLYAANQVGTLSQASSDFLASHAGLAAKIATAISVMDPNLKNVLLSETVLLNRFFTQFQESDADRNAIVSALTDPTVLGLGADLSTTLEADRDLVLSQTEAQGLLASISGTVSSHVRFFADKQREYSRKKEVADSMLTFAQKLGSSKPADAASYQDARVQNWRTYSGSEAAYRDTAYANYEKDYATQLAAYNADPTKNPYPGPKLSANEYFNALSLNVTSVNNGKTASEILNGDYAGNLLSDDPAGTIPVQIDDPDHPGQKKTVYINKYGAVTVKATSAADFKEVYYANLANNYIDAISHLSASLSGIVEAANLADSRASADTDEITKLATIANDAANTDNAKKEAAILAEQQLRQSDAAANGDQQITQVQSDFGSAIGATAKAQDDYASAGRRSLINRIGSQKYMKDILDAASKGLADAQATVKTLSDASVSLQATYNALVGDYTNRMNDMAAAFREFTARNKEAQTRQDIKDFASTPYLYLADNAAGTAGLASNVGDAQNMFNSAKTALDAINKQLANAADLVFAEDHMSDFATVAAAVSSAKKAGTDPASLYPPLSTAEAKTLADLRAKAVKLVDDQGNKIAIDGTTGTPLSVSERDQLTALTQRELYANYADVFTTRAEFLEQSLRTIRIEKAAAILQSEIAKRSAEAQKAKTDFTQVLESNFRISRKPGMTDADWADAQKARDGVYKRLASVVGSGGNMFNEFRAWFWGSPTWLQSYGGAWASSVGQMQPNLTPLIGVEAAAGMITANNMTEGDHKAIGAFLGAGGVLSEFSGFSGAYFAYLGSLGILDNSIADATLINAIYYPMTLQWMVSAQSLMLQAARYLIMGPFGIAGYSMTMGQVAIALTMVKTAWQKIASANSAVAASTWQAGWTLTVANQTAGDSSVRAVIAKEQIYQNAKAGLDYFTKIPDMQTLKTRLIEWGKQHTDDPNEVNKGSDLYNLTDDDIKYLYDSIVGLRDSRGNAITLASAESQNGLDVKSKKKDMAFEDVFGNAYNPDRSTMLDSPPGPLSNGVYQGSNGSTYTKIRVMLDNGTTVEKYALVVAPGSQQKGFDLLDILPMIVNHMEGIRDNAKSAYLAAGQAAGSKTGDSSFVLNEQSDVFKEIFTQSVNRENGGREFAGYTNAYNDFSQNAKAISDQELSQREALQKQEWDLKEQDFQDRRSEWETKIGNILDRGKKEWAENQSRFLQQWDEWEKKFDKDTKDGQATWDAKMAQFYTDRGTWKAGMQTQSARATVTNTLTGTINDLNSQLAQFAQNTGLPSRSIDLQATLAQAYASIEKTMPTNTDRLRDINNDISNFNTQLALSQMSGQNLMSSISGLQSQIQTAMSEQEKNMQILAGVQMFEQYRKIREQMVASFEDQNRSVDQQTSADAASAGYIRQGNVFIKAGTDAAYFGAVNAYTFFDTQSAIREELEKTGFKEMTSDALKSFLSTKSQPEMDAYFTMQKTALAVAMQNITGRGNAEERKGSQNIAVIGRFNAWAGSKGDDNNAYVADNVFGRDTAHPDNALLFNTFLNGGFGELGAAKTRPGGAPFGFYVQLAVSGKLMTQEGQRRALGANQLDPVTMVVDQFNPATLFANSLYKVEAYDADHHGSSVHMWVGETVQAMKAPAKAAIAVVSSVVTPILAGIGSIFGPGGTVIGASIGVLASTLANAAVDGWDVGEGGKVSFSMTTKKWAADLALGMASLVPGGPIAIMLTNLASQFVMEGFNWDEKGNATGWSMDSDKWDEFAVDGTIGAGLALAGGASGLKGGALKAALGAAGTATGVLGAYAKQQIIHDPAHYAAYQHYANTGIEGLGSLAALGIAINEAQNGSINKWMAEHSTSIGGYQLYQSEVAKQKLGILMESTEWMTTEERLAVLADHGFDSPEMRQYVEDYEARQAKDFGDRQQAALALKGWAARRKEDDLENAKGASGYAWDSRAKYDNNLDDRVTMTRSGTVVFDSSSDLDRQLSSNDFTRLSQAREVVFNGETWKSIGGGMFGKFNADGSKEVVSFNENGLISHAITMGDRKTVEITDARGETIMQVSGARNMNVGKNLDEFYKMDRDQVEEYFLSQAEEHEINVGGNRFGVRESETGRLKEIHYLDGVGRDLQGNPIERVRFWQRANQRSLDDQFNMTMPEDGLRNSEAAGGVASPFSTKYFYVNDIVHGPMGSENFPYLGADGKYKPDGFHELSGHEGGDYLPSKNAEGAAIGRDVFAIENGNLYFRNLAKNGIVDVGANNGMVLVTEDGQRNIFYMHSSGMAAGLRSGDYVKAGDYIGRMGNNGYSGGTHSHIAVQYANQEWMDSARFIQTYIGPTGRIPTGNLYLLDPEWQKKNQHYFDYYIPH